MGQSVAIIFVKQETINNSDVKIFSQLALGQFFWDTLPAIQNSI